MSTSAYKTERLRRALMYFVGGRAIQAVGRIVSILLMVRILAVADYGAYMLIIGTAEMLLMVTSFGLVPVAQRYLPQLLGTQPIGSLYRFVALLVVTHLMIIATIAYLLGFFWEMLAPFFGFNGQQISATMLAPWLFLVVPASRFSTVILEALLEQGKIQIAATFLVVGRVAIFGVLWLVVPYIGLRTALIVDLAVNSIALLLTWWFIRNSLATLHSSVNAGTMPVREMVRCARHMALVGPMSATAMPGAIRLTLANTLGVEEIALFSFLQSLERLVSQYLPGTLLRGLILPVLISRSVGRGGADVLAAGTGMLLKSNLAMVAGGVVMVAVCGNELVALLSGGKFVNGGFTLLLLYIAMIVLSQRHVLEMIMQITGHTIAIGVTAVAAPVALLLVWVFSVYGLNFAVVSIMGASLVANWISSSILVRSTDWFRLDWRGITAIFLPAGGAIALGLLGAMWLHPIVVGGVMVVLYSTSLWITKPFKRLEIGMIERVIGNNVARVIRGLAV